MKIIETIKYKTAISIEKNDSHIWICDQCMFARPWSYKDLVEMGRPYCPTQGCENFGNEMEPPNLDI